MSAIRQLAILGDGTASSPCDACIAGCCRAFNLVVEGFDAYRIARDLKLPLSDFIGLRWSEKQEGDHRVILDASVPPAERRYHRMILLRVADTTVEPFTQRCTFLITVGGRGRCAIYFSRPSMCRTYPTHLNDGVISVRGGDHCPKDAWHGETLDVGLFRARQLFRLRQRAIYDYLIEGWNARVLARGSKRSAGDYAQYLVYAYRSLEERQPSWFVETQPCEPEKLGAEVIDREVSRVLAELGWVSVGPEPDLHIELESIVDPGALAVGSAPLAVEVPAPPVEGAALAVDSAPPPVEVSAPAAGSVAAPTPESPSGASA